MGPMATSVLTDPEGSGSPRWSQPVASGTRGVTRSAGWQSSLPRADEPPSRGSPKGLGRLLLLSSPCPPRATAVHPQRQRPHRRPHTAHDRDLEDPRGGRWRLGAGAHGVGERRPDGPPLRKPGLEGQVRVLRKEGGPAPQSPRPPLSAGRGACLQGGRGNRADR